MENAQRVPIFIRHFNSRFQVPPAISVAHFLNYMRDYRQPTRKKTRLPKTEGLENFSVKHVTTTHGTRNQVFFYSEAPSDGSTSRNKAPLITLKFN
jgi:hypothetical protein